MFLIPCSPYTSHIVFHSKYLTGMCKLECGRKIIQLLRRRRDICKENILGFMVLFSMAAFVGTEGQDTLISFPLHFLSRLRWSVLRERHLYVSFTAACCSKKATRGQDAFHAEWQQACNSRPITAFCRQYHVDSLSGVKVLLFLKVPLSSFPPDFSANLVVAQDTSSNFQSPRILLWESSQKAY